MFDLKRFRKDKKVGQKAIQDLFNCKQSFISALETGRRELNDDHLAKLSEVFGDITPYITPDNISVFEFDKNANSTSIRTFDEIAEQRKIIVKSQEQIDRLLTILENQTKN